MSWSAFRIYQSTQVHDRCGFRNFRPSSKENISIRIVKDKFAFRKVKVQIIGQLPAAQGVGDAACVLQLRAPSATSPPARMNLGLEFFRSYGTQWT